MVDCGNPRCAQERRLCKKELLSWSKKIPQVIGWCLSKPFALHHINRALRRRVIPDGCLQAFAQSLGAGEVLKCARVALEQIAASQSNKKNWKLLQKALGGATKSEPLEDWKADECCFFCHGQLNYSLGRLEELIADIKNGELDCFSAYVRSLHDLLPFCTKYYTTDLGQELLAEARSRNSHSGSAASSSHITRHMAPSAVTPHSTNHAAHRPLVELNIPRILHGNRQRGNGYRGESDKHRYDDRDMGTAVGDMGTAVRDVGTAVRDVKTAVGDVGTAVRDVKTAVGDMGTAVRDVKTAVGDVGTAVRDVKTAVGDMGTAVRDVKTAVGDVGTAVRDVKTAVGDVGQGTLGAESSPSLHGDPCVTKQNSSCSSCPDSDRCHVTRHPEDSSRADEAMATCVAGGMTVAKEAQTALFKYSPSVLLSFLPVRAKSDVPGVGTLNEQSVKLDHVRQMHNLTGDQDLHFVPAHLSEPKLPLVNTLIHRLVEQRFQVEVRRSQPYQEDMGRADTGKTNSRTSSPLTEERRNMAISVDTLPSFVNHGPVCTKSSLSFTVPPANEELRIPSYRPTGQSCEQTHVDAVEGDSRSFGKVYEMSHIGATLKDIVVKPIIKKMRFENTDALSSSAHGSISHVPPHRDTFSHKVAKSVIHSCRSDLSKLSHSSKCMKQQRRKKDRCCLSVNECDVSQTPPTTSSRGNVGEKKGPSHSQSWGGRINRNGGDKCVKKEKTRSKRGQYRRYSSQLLLDAVRAVQSGEMSVHRAGSHFGVPHSTLEYKVKERHLLRHKRPHAVHSGVHNTSTSSVSSPPLAASGTASSVTGTVTISPQVPTAGFDTISSSSTSSSQLQKADKLETILPKLCSHSTTDCSVHGTGSEGVLPQTEPCLVSHSPSVSIVPGVNLVASSSHLFWKLQRKVQH